MVPMVDIDTIGAGGGSIAYVDQGGVFRVGPQSAGAIRARPVTDAAARSRPRPTRSSCSGRLRADRGLLGGAMQLDRELARAAIEASLRDSA
jgi:5-oxoprolinase (ATP-hydrolysing)